MQAKSRYNFIVSKYLQKYLYLPYILIALVSQFFSLLRHYPTNNPCAQVFSVAKHTSLLINCDSAVFMKDAQNPARLFNGDSVYQDRPLPTLLVSVLSKVWHYFTFPDYQRSVVGNSGVSFTYSLLTYVLFLFLNVLILSIACWLGLKLVLVFFKNYNIDFVFYPRFAIFIVSIISLNEITKTFFWTPHSQMFNLLLPVYFFFLLQFRNTNIESKFFVINCFFILVLLFCYAFYILLIIPMLIMNWKNIETRILMIVLCVTPYLLYPTLLELFGGQYYSLGLEKYRLFIWLLDSIKNAPEAPSIYGNFYSFIKTFPIFPVFLIIVLLLWWFLQKNSFSVELFKLVKFEFYAVLIYFLFLAVYGYYARRLTYTLIIFLTLIILKVFLYNFNRLKDIRYFLLLKVVSGIIFFSWIFTNGPLV